MENDSQLSNNIENNYVKLLELEPKLVSSTVAANAAEQQQMFMTGAVRNPDREYPKLAEVNEERFEDLESVSSELLSNPGLPEKHRPVYEDFTEGYKKKTRLMQLMHEVKSAPDEMSKAVARQEFMDLNVELYGSPDKTTYIALVQEKMASIDAKQLDGPAIKLRDELKRLIPQEYLESEVVERFKPSDETVEWMHGAVETIYGSMLARIPEDKDLFDEHEVAAIFTDILQNEFGEATAEWTVDVEKAQSINVKSAEKRVVIPENRGDLSREILSKLVVHELGIHVLRSVTGEQADMGPLRTGLNEYYDAEEGLGKVMEQALAGKYQDAGIKYYIVAGAAYHDNKDFRDLYEMQWRLGALDKVKSGGELTAMMIESSQKMAYNDVTRILRGTDELPWFKDLAYYNGNAETWKYIESIRGDDFLLTLLLMGKINTSKKHRDIILESKTY